MNAKSAGLLLGLALIAAVAGFLAYQWRQGAQPDSGGGQAPELVLTDIEQRPRAIAEWRGKLLLVNFWATWCAPCLNEIPLLVKAQAQYGERGLQIIGPALDEVDAVKAALPRLGIRYPVLVGDSQISDAMTAFGDTLGALPYSVLIGPDGRILQRKHGEFQPQELKALIEQNLP